MQTIEPFAWRRLTPKSQVEHRVDEEGEIVLRGTTDAPPFTTARVQDGQGGFVDRDLASLGLMWVRAIDDADGWVLRTHGEPETMAWILGRWLAAVRGAVSSIDERVVTATIPCEVGRADVDADGYLKASRTERGYPDRAGERDPGDFDRDLQDWNRPGHGAHSSHGLMQTLIATALAVRPGLFAGVEPSRYRTVLWNPDNALACGVAYLESFPADVRSDPLACRITYGAGSVRPSSATRWGAVVYSELVPLRFIAFWNDEVEVRMHGRALPQPTPSTPSGVPVAEESPGPWVFAAAAWFLAALATCVALFGPSEDQE
jgi:hypothetical protein